MLGKFIIDGNNLIGKDPTLKELQKKAPQASREKLALKLERYFINRNVQVSLHFDGFPKEAIPTNKIKIHYSYSQTADEKIREEIDLTTNPKLITLVTSDEALRSYGKVNACKLVSSSEFWNMLETKEVEDLEEKIQKGIDEEEILRLFLEDENSEES